MPWKTLEAHIKNPINFSILRLKHPVGPRYTRIMNRLNLVIIEGEAIAWEDLGTKDFPDGDGEYRAYILVLWVLEPNFRYGTYVAFEMKYSDEGLFDIGIFGAHDGREPDPGERLRSKASAQNLALGKYGYELIIREKA